MEPPRSAQEGTASADPWLFTGAPDPLAGGEVTLMEGTTFAISDGRGDIKPGGAQGLFVRDTRVLDRWRLAVDHRRLGNPTVSLDSPHDATILLLAGERGEPAGSVLVVRHRYVGEGMREDLTLRSAVGSPLTLRVSLRVGADFADLFEVKERRAMPLRPEASASGGELRLRTRRGEEDLAVVIDTDGTADAESGTITWEVSLAPHGHWTTTILVHPHLRGHALTTPYPRGSVPAQAEPALRRERFRAEVPSLWSADDALLDLLRRSVTDLATLQIHDPARPDLPVVAAGAPWFMALFGRDSLLTALMLLPVDAGLAVGTLRALGRHQGTRTDPVSEEEPGRILHEMRFGPAGQLALGGRPAYYGSADATPLFALAVGELHRWHPELVTDDLVAQMDRALAWVVGDGDPDGDGFVEYARKTERGLVNQGWKDSFDGINFADGTIAEPPIALAEVQGYAYAAFRARADLAQSRGDEATARRWRDRAARLRGAFDDAFWLPDRGWYAVGLDRDKRPIDALTSNIGHCLWSGIAEPERAAVVAEHLASPAMFTGWGVRTLASTMGAYDPLSYHNGSVWPHDTALCAAGLARYGHVEQAKRLAVGLLDAAGHFADRLPELFGGFGRDEVPIPVPYPAACAPQAWAAAAPLELLRGLLRLEAGGPTDPPRADPALPERLMPLRIRDIGYRGGRYEIVVEPTGWFLRRQFIA